MVERQSHPSGSLLSLPMLTLVGLDAGGRGRVGVDLAGVVRPCGAHEADGHAGVGGRGVDIAVVCSWSVSVVSATTG
jgi:hypothetical protein